MQPSAITGAIISSAMKIHTELGPGLLESAYKACLAYDLTQKGFHVDVEAPVPVIYGGVKLECGYRMDLLIEGIVVVELKAVDALAPIHQAQLLSHMKLSGHHIGLLINFNVVRLKDGIKRMVC